MAERVLSEYKSKVILSKYNINIPPGAMVENESSAIEVVKKIGYPVVIKGVSEKILHKTEAGIVLIGINSDEKLIEGIRLIKRRAGDVIDGYLIEKQILGKREFIAGIIKDAQFGHCIMFGLGGIFTEALEDVVFRVAPIDPVDAEEMIDEIRSKKLLSSFRGEREVNKGELSKLLVNLSKVPECEGNIKEIDINPIIPFEDKVYAVDAVIVLTE